MRRALTILIVVAGTVVPATPARAEAPPSGSIGVRLLDAPTDRRTDPRARLYIVDHLAPGTTIRRRIDVTNDTATAQNVTVYPGAASIEHGTFTFADKATPNELTTWTHLDTTALPLPAGAHHAVSVTIAVPKDAAPGERYAVVWPQVSSPSSTGTVAEVNRVGIRIYLSVSPGGEPASNFTIDTLTAERTSTGQPVVRAQVHNTGGRALDMSGTLQLADGPGSLTAGPFPAQLGTTLAVADTESVTVPLDPRLPAGPWHARIQLNSGLLTRTADATITFPTHAGQSQPVPATPATSDTKWPFVVGSVIGLLLLLLLLLLVWRRRSREPEHQLGRHHPGRAQATPPTT